MTFEKEKNRGDGNLYLMPPRRDKTVVIKSGNKHLIQKSSSSEEIKHSKTIKSKFNRTS